MRILQGLLIALVLFTQAYANDTGGEQLAATLLRLNRVIAENPRIALHYVERGDAYSLVNEHHRAVADYTTAITLDDTQDNAYFGRGIAYGRMGLADEGIADLSIYIARHPDSSVAYTKRGVRNIWRGNLQDAEHDLKRAVELDPNNAEAHDDLGVVHAKHHRIGVAAEHFSTAIKLDPSYQKAYHNLAMCYFMADQPQHALDIVDAGLVLDTDNRNSLLLKATILHTLGRETEAKIIGDRAEFLPEANWSERSAIGGVSKRGE